MKDYPDRMTVEEARAFQAEVLNIVSQIPRDSHLGWLAQSFTDGGAYTKIYTRGGETALSSGCE